ncbi:discoidin domain-containing protein [Scleromatobacter humisilvae]|uniref:Discoidin domain-containing protein n=1 Tax=Scleromatobacter humisilvae TaxID=2897159 RepID=A0A9X2C1P0_9BURK|nr:discoidin domain-containing protein [Scleromatobacter humisilvae]MCK9689028.1 discoidin domain-containing protein [Scleromatobacter humisilvae]
MKLKSLVGTSGWLGAFALALALAACGGGGGSGSDGGTPPDNGGGAGSGSGGGGAGPGTGTGTGPGTGTGDGSTGTTASVPVSNRVTINLGATPWRYLKDKDPATAMNPSYDDTSTNTQEVWSDVGVPQSPSDNDTFLNLPSGGGQGQLTGNILWYRKHFTLDASYANRKVFVEFEGAQMGARVFINGNFIPGNSLLNPQATHVIGFTPFIVDLTPYVKTDGSDNVLAVKVARGDSFFNNPDFSGAFRFGQADSGLFRPVWMYLKDRVYIPQNTWATLNTWGTYVSTLSASSTSATIRVQTNVRNEYATDQAVTLLTQIVDAKGNVVASTQDSKTIASAPLPTTPAKTDPTVAPPPPVFDQTLTVANPTLWYPNNSTWGKPYLYKVIHTVSVNGVVVDATSTPLGIRTITWDQNFPIINGHPHHLWGGSGRYDYPALGSAVPEEQKWRDVELLAAAGGSLYRPGHSSEGPEFLAAADAFGVMVIQPSGDGENGFANLCPKSTGSDRPNGCNANGDDIELKKETHRDMIVHDRNNPSVLAWEADNGSTDTSFAQSIKALSRIWDPVLTRAQGDRTPNPANGDILGCSGDGCDIGVKSQYPNSPAWGSEYWGDGVQRALYDYELLFAVNPVKNWSKGLRQNVFGMAHWYLADTPGEITSQVDGPDRPPYGVATGTQPALGATTGTQPFMMRGNAASMMDANRFPRLIYWIYQAAWTPFEIKPVVHLAYHWNRTGNVTVNAFSNCPSVRLLINDQPQGADQIPNPQNMDPGNDTGPNTVSLPRQAHWNVSWAAGKLTAQCLDASSRVVTDAAGNAVADTQVTAGPADHIVLTVDPAIVRPNGQAFQVSANGTDAAFVIATVVDAAGNRVPDAKNILTFAVSGPGTYRGGTDSYVTFTQGQTPRDDANGVPGNFLPQGYHAPGDPNLSAEGGLAKVAVRAQFTPGTVTVTASSNGLKSGSATFNVVAASGTTATGAQLHVAAQPNALAIVTPPASQVVTVGQSAQFSVLATSTAPVTFQWMKGATAIAGATGFAYTTPVLTADDNGASWSVVVTSGATSVPSAAATVTVVAPSVPTIATAPAAQTVAAGGSAQFSVVANGSPLLTYQWRKNGANIAGATASTYTTPTLQTADSGSTWDVVVTNSAGTVTSTAARLTVTAGTAPAIVTQPAGASVSAGQSLTLSVVAAGSGPLHYQWQLNGSTNVGTDSSTFTIAAAQASDAGTYTVTVSNGSGSVPSSGAVVTVSGGNGPDLALNATPSASSQNGGNLAKYAFDGDLSTANRWESTQGVDPSWIAADMGSVKAFDRVVLTWENAYASAYQIQVSPDNNAWTTIQTVAGKGGTETVNFPTTNSRYVRMLGTARATTFGYSLYEMQVFDVPQCGGSGERYTTVPAQPGTWNSTIAGLPSGPFVPTVIDNVTKLTWQQYVTTFPTQGAQFTQPVAAQYCTSVGMRLPTQTEALTIANSNYAQCAFPNPWTTWTSTGVAGDATRAYFVSSAGVSSSQIIDNSPGWSLCVSGTQQASPQTVQQLLKRMEPAATGRAAKRK